MRYRLSISQEFLWPKLNSEEIELSLVIDMSTVVPDEQAQTISQLALFVWDLMKQSEGRNSEHEVQNHD